MIGLYLPVELAEIIKNEAWEKRISQNTLISLIVAKHFNFDLKDSAGKLGRPIYLPKPAPSPLTANSVCPLGSE